MCKRLVAGIDLFCGAGGLTYGLRKAGIRIVAGIDLDPACEFPFTANNHVPFIKEDIKRLTGAYLSDLYPSGAIRLLAGCAPCRPFSPFRRGSKNFHLEEWRLLREFSRSVTELKPELVTMENVPDLASTRIFRDFVRTLRKQGYMVDWQSLYCPQFGVPQHRRRLVLLASRIGTVNVPKGSVRPANYRTVRDAIGGISQLRAGETDPKDRLHKARSVTELNLKRFRACRAGGTWRDWPPELRAPCHQKKTGSTYQSVYARMVWDQPSPTITTQAYSFGTGRFGHPEQDRSITLREAALLQSFPRNYRFVQPNEPVFFRTIGRLIGNAVPPRLAFYIGKELIQVAQSHRRKKDA